jgi:uncharacterized protein (TIGR03066 family)
MNFVRVLFAGLVLCALALNAKTEDPRPDKSSDNGKLLVGTWKATKADKDAGVPEGTVATFTKDGKFKVTFEKDGKEEIHDGQYKVDGDKFSLMFKKGSDDRELTITIKKLTDDELLTEESGKRIEWQRKKGS